MGILGLLTIALVAGTLARTAYRGTVPDDIGLSLLAGAVGIAAGHGASTLTGVFQVASVADMATWLTVLTGTFIALALGDALRTAAQPLRSLSRAS